MTNEHIENLILAVPVIGFLIFFLNYFMKDSERERKINRKRDEQDSEIIIGLKHHVEESNKKHDESNKKHDETIVKIDHIIRKIDK